MLKPAMTVALFAVALTPAAPAFAAADATTVMALVESTATLRPGRYVWQDEAVLGPVSILISIPEQRAYIYRGQTIIAVSSVSTGKGDKPTPTGLFTILQKAEVHHSSLYAAAPMPYMQRLTWDGVAMHAGKNPGFPASHGCIRLPSDFAKKLFDATEMGATVEIVDTPVLEGTPAPMGDAQVLAEGDGQGAETLAPFPVSR